jgi:hypothetical protein
VSVESLKAFFDIAAVVLLFLTFVAGAGVLFTGNIINNRQASQLRQFDQNLTAAKSELAKQQERAAKAEAAIASAQAEAAKANKSAEDERTERVKLQERVAWRTISPADIARIGSKLSTHRGIRIGLGALAGNEEAVSFSEDIADIVRTAGWPFPGVASFTNLGVQSFGLRISTTRDDPTRTAAQDLKRELDKLGFDPAYDESDKVFAGGGPGIYVFVELRPRIVPINRNSATKP